MKSQVSELQLHQGIKQEKGADAPGWQCGRCGWVFRVSEMARSRAWGFWSGQRSGPQLL